MTPESTHRSAQQAPVQAESRPQQFNTTVGWEDLERFNEELSMSGDKTRALERFARNFETEKNLCVRGSLFRFSARTAGKDALTVIANMDSSDPRFQGQQEGSHSA